VEALRRRSLLEWGSGGTFTLQPVVLEYTTARLVAALAQEILAGEPALSVRYALLKATAKDYVRRSQERLIAHPLLERLRGELGSAAVVEERLLALLDIWRGRPAAEQGYGPGNVVNLLRLLRGDLRGLDLSRLAIRQAYLQEVAMQDADLTGAHLAHSVLAEAFGQVISVALSADGALLAAGASNGEVCLWRVADRTLIMAVPAHAGTAYAVALSADGRRLASGGGDGLVRVWNADNGACVATMSGHIVQSVALSADGRLLASSGADGTVHLWEAEGGARLAALHGHRGVVHSVALSGDGRLLASGGEDGTIRIWDSGRATCWAVLQGDSTVVYGVALSPDGQLAVSGAGDGTVRLWDVGKGRQRAAWHAHTGRVAAVAVSGDGRILASGGDDGAVRIWEALGGACLATLRGYHHVVLGVALSADGQLAASGGSDGAARLWVARGGECLMTLQGSVGVVWGVTLAVDGRLIASGGGDGLIRLWDAERGVCRAVLQGHTGRVHRVVLSSEGHILASGGEDGAVWLWDVERGERLGILRGHSGLIYTLAMNPDGCVLTSAGEEGTIRLWDLPGSTCRAVLEGHDGLVIRLAMSADGGLVASASIDGTVRLWDSPNWTCRRILRGHLGPVSGVALSADGHIVASSGEDGTVRLWDTESGACRAVLRGHDCWVALVALSADGRLLASGAIDGSVRLWEAGSGEALASWAGHAGGTWGMVWSADGRHLVTCGGDGTVKVWEVPSGAARRVLRPDRLYEGMDIAGLTGVTEAQRAALLALGAVEQAREQAAPPHPVREALPPPTLHTPASAGAMPAQPVAAGTPVRPPTNLPPSRTTFVGRTAEVARLTVALDQASGKGVRLLTLTGVAGCGKTRLALQVADTVVDAYDDGAWRVELAPLPASEGADPTAVVAATLTALGLQEQPGQAPLDTLVSHLGPRRVLLVLDNCAHVVAACAALAPSLLGACPALQILATSQIPLGIAGETVWHVDALTLPDPVAGLPTEASLARLGQSEAVQLFVQRAQAMEATFVLSAATAAGVAAICRRLDGLPLAIELAAARLKVLSLEEILGRLDDRFQLLRRIGRSADARHQTLQTTLDWSYGLLDPSEKAVLRRGGGRGGGSAGRARRAAGPLAGVCASLTGGAAIWVAGDGAALWSPADGARGRDSSGTGSAPPLVRGARRAGRSCPGRTGAVGVAGTAGARA
jgi:WD40 repeat protein